MLSLTHTSTYAEFKDRILSKNNAFAPLTSLDEKNGMNMKSAAKASKVGNQPHKAGNRIR